jgi:hypothetical protein
MEGDGGRRRDTEGDGGRAERREKEEKIEAQIFSCAPYLSFRHRKVRTKGVRGTGSPRTCKIILYRPKSCILSI